ncbi:MAG: hypothetical protein N2Z21_05635 [Candidatus Sumerlaeaceae bacterium]|nr:hypothetical protein [Candidatus Sumerlaeaceae bacterium]
MQTKRTGRFFKTVYFLFSLHVSLFAAGADISQILQAYQNSSTPQSKEAALKQILNNYDSFKHHVAQHLGAGTMPPDLRSTVKEIDDRIIEMTKQAWSDVIKRDPQGVTHVLPIGSLGEHLSKPEGSKYVPGKSDKDLVPMGPGASRSVEQFKRAFATKFGISPEKLDINILDPTNPSSWPGRVEAVVNPEKYNTIGGNKYLQSRSYEQNPTLWHFDPKTGELKEKDFRSLFPKGAEPPPLTKADAAGFFSDNTRFRNELVSKCSDPAELILKQAKYDGRNAAAYALAGGSLTAEEQALINAARLAERGQVADAISQYAKTVGLDVSTEAGRQAAMKAYLENMNSLTEKIAQKVVATHLDEIARAGKGAGSLIAELGGALNNIPPAMRESLIKEFSKDVSRAETIRLANQVANTLAKDVFIKKAFDEAAAKLFGKPYDQLSSAEKLIVHNAGEESAGMLSKFGKGAGLTLMGAAILISMQQAYAGEVSRGTAIGASAALGRGILDLVQMGYPPLVAAELAGRAAAFGISTTIDSYKMDVLEKLYEQYRRTGNLDDVLNDAEFQKYFPGGLRVFRNELREAAAREGKTLTEDQLDKLIRDYFLQREKIDQETAKVQRELNWARAFVSSRHIPLVPGSDSDLDNSKLSDQELEAALAQVLLTKMGIENQLRGDGVPFTRQDILHILFLYYRSTPDELKAYMASIYRRVGKTYPQERKKTKKPTVKMDVSDRKTSPPQQITSKALQVLQATNAKVIRGPKSQKQCPSGILLSGSGSFKEHPVDAPCDPPIFLGSTEIACGGELRVVVDVDRAVPQVWSLRNTNTSVEVFYTPRLGGKLGMETGLGAACGTWPTGDTSVTLVAPGPGTIKAIAGAPSGSGPLSGSCFSQSFNAHVELTKPFNEIPAEQTTELQDGDTLRTTGWHSLVTVGSTQGERVTVGRGEAQVAVKQTASGATQFVVENAANGTMVRYASAPSKKATAQQPTFREGQNNIKPKGTDFLLTHEGETTRVAVLEDEVLVESDDGYSTTVMSGHVFDMKRRVAEAYQQPQDNPLVIDGIPPTQILHEPAETSPTHVGVFYESGEIQPNWRWIDGNTDARIEAGDTSTVLTILVPPGNELSTEHVTAPVLLHDVTGDFDLHATIDAVTTATDSALVHFVVHQPGGFLGYHNRQRDASTYAAHFWTLGGLQLMQNRWELTTLSGEGKRPNFETSPTAVRLKLTRRGNLWKSYASVDHGITWHLLTRAVTDCAPSLYVGLVFQRLAYDGLTKVPVKFVLRDVSLVSAPRGGMPIPEWDVCAPYGAAGVTDEAITLAIPSGQSGVSRIETGAPFEGDFDIVAEYELPAWRNNSAQTANFLFYVCNLSHSNFAYIGRGATPQEGERVQTDLRQDETWYRGYQWVDNRDRAGRIRIKREGSSITSYYWTGERWQRLDQGFRGGWTEPVFLGFMVSNEGAQQATVGAQCRVVQIRQGNTLPPPSVAPEDEVPIPVELTPVSVQSALTLPDGWDVSLVETPYELGTLFPVKEGGVFVFSGDKKVARLIKIADNLAVTDSISTQLLSGINRKVGLDRGQTLLIAIDGWWESGNPFSGVFELASNGSSWRKLDNAPSLDDIGAMMGYGGKSILVADFSYGSLQEYLLADSKTVSLIASCPELKGVVSFAVDSQRSLAVAATSKTHGASRSGLYRIDLKTKPVKPVPIWTAEDEKCDFRAVVWDKTTLAPNDVLVGVANENAIWRFDLDRSDVRETVVAELPAPRALRWSGNTLWAVCGSRNIAKFTCPVPHQSQVEKSSSASSVPSALTPKPPLTTGDSRQEVVGDQASKNRPATENSITELPASERDKAVGNTSATGSPRGFVMRSPKDSVLLNVKYPQRDFELSLIVNWEQAGTILDTVGIDAAPRGAWVVLVDQTGHLMFQIYDPQSPSSVRAANGWHILRSKRSLARGKEALVQIVHVGASNTYQLAIGGSLEAQLAIPTTLSGKPVYVGDYPPDAHWAPRYPTEKGFIGMARITYFGPRRQVDKSPPTNARPHANPVRSAGELAQQSLAVGLEHFVGRWEIIPEHPSAEKEFIVLRMVDGKVLGTGGRDSDVIVFDKMDNNQVIGSVTPRESRESLPLRAWLGDDDNHLIIRIAPPASEYVLVKARRVGGSPAPDRRKAELEEQLQAALDEYSKAVEGGTDDEVKAAKRHVDELKAKLLEIKTK